MVYCGGKVAYKRRIPGILKRPCLSLIRNRYPLCSLTGCREAGGREYLLSEPSHTVCDRLRVFLEAHGRYGPWCGSHRYK